MVSPVPVTVMVAARVVACATTSAINNPHPNRLVFLPDSWIKLTNVISTFLFANTSRDRDYFAERERGALLETPNELDAIAVFQKVKRLQTFFGVLSLRNETGAS
ncbi:MAG: hypothetical protein DME45_08560 [Verrucomicrobia bacterium]|nr:MAG: hypothetical protein DME45_08560 [Verrucomicrobiota bacterium]